MQTYSAMEIANFIIDTCTKNHNPVSNLRLQKLLYFVWVDFYRETGRYIFLDNMQAWQLGPVVPDVYYEYCAYGGKPINLCCETFISPEDTAILKEIIEKYLLVPVSVLVERTHMPDTAWYKVYNNGQGNRNVIPFWLIRQTEFGE
ncbi:MAG: DUF4065 domain-containing protein [Lachnospiraceae bacterium]|nr:DUF4065 domain-containing protein [Lachnospiraceae bacterium]